MALNHARTLGFSLVLVALNSFWLPSLAAAEDAIVVLDASGSMWGRVEDKEKIVIARDVIGNLLSDLPAERNLGLVAYGHNRKGDCSDIEELAPVGADRDAIRASMNKLNPKGKTPLSASVKFAAEKLKYTENKATVILVSDGIETCDLDPCEVGTELEQAGIDFTAHVIGFDVDEVEQAGLQCLAENTGGKFLSADNAQELTTALQETVAQAPEPAKTSGLALRATELAGGPVIITGLNWKIQQAGGGEVLFEAQDIGEAKAELPGGVYDVFVEQPSTGLKGESKLVELNTGTEKTVTIPLEFDLEATVRSVPEGEAPVSSEIVVYWTGPDRISDYITITKPEDRAGAYTNYKYTKDGNPLKVRMPNTAGEYEVRYMLSKPARILARVPITATAVEATLTAAGSVSAGAQFDVNWTGPAYNDDWITIVKPDAGERAYTSYAYTRDGNPLRLKAPLDPGEYELRYLQAGQKIIARMPVTVTGVDATITGPPTAMAGTYHDVRWTGPGAHGDWMTITAPTADERAYTDYKYMRDGNPLKLRMPLEAGSYEFRYVQDGKKVIARQTIQITEAIATLTAPDGVQAGQSINVAFTGPNSKGDWVTVTKPADNERKYTSYKYARDGSPAKIDMPLEPGDYELRYVLDGKKVVARRPIIVSDVTATITAPSSAVATTQARVEWEGPANYRDYLTIAKPDAPNNFSGGYRYARDGSPSQLNVPRDPGDYEVRYVLGGKRIIARVPIKVTPAP